MATPGARRQAVSTRTAVVRALVADVVLLAAAIGLGVSIWTVFLAYWLHSAVIGIRALTERTRPAPAHGSPVGRTADAGFFWLSWSMHGILVLVFPVVMTFAEEPVGPPVVVDPAVAVGVVACLVALERATHRAGWPADPSRSRLAWRFTIQTASIILGTFGSVVAAWLGVVGAVLPIAARDLVEMVERRRRARTGTGPS